MEVCEKMENILLAWCEGWQLLQFHRSLPLWLILGVTDESVIIIVPNKFGFVSCEGSDVKVHR